MTGTLGNIVVCFFIEFFSSETIVDVEKIQNPDCPVLLDSILVRLLNGPVLEPFEIRTN
jgi:hypothetical protein